MASGRREGLVSGVASGDDNVASRTFGNKMK